MYEAQNDGLAIAIRVEIAAGVERTASAMWWGWLLHPFLVASYFVLTLAAANPTALHGWRDLAVPTAISVGFCGLCWAAAFLLTRNGRKASLPRPVVGRRVLLCSGTSRKHFDRVAC